jgi:hypothetical protein
MSGAKAGAFWGNAPSGSGDFRSTRLGETRDSAAELGSAFHVESLTHDRDAGRRASPRRDPDQYGKTLKLKLTSLDSPVPTTISADCVP